MSSQCYACTDLGSIAPLRQYFCHSESPGRYMHTNCFLNFAAWYANIRAILHAWALCSRRIHRIRSIKYLKQVRRRKREKWMEWIDRMRKGPILRMKALECVLTWQREAREKWKAAKADTMCTRSFCRRPFTLWAQEIRDRSPAPSLIDSSSESNNIYSFPLTDSSSGSD